MKNKIKGSNAERELLFMLYEKGFAVSRVAGSGSSPIPTPDIIAIKNKVAIAIECKSKKGEYLNIKESQVNELKIWQNLSKCPVFIAWKISREGWYFMNYLLLNKTNKAYSIKKKDIKENGKIFEEFIKNY